MKVKEVIAADKFTEHKVVFAVLDSFQHHGFELTIVCVIWIPWVQINLREWIESK